MRNNNKKIILIGPLPPPLGGVSVLFNALASELSGRSDVDIEIINTGNIRGKGIKGVLRFISLVKQIAKSVRTADVVTLHSATSGLHIMGPSVAYLSRLNNKPLIIRKFGGTDFLKYKPIRRYLIQWALRRAEIYLAETKYLVKAARECGLHHAEWYSNSRPMPVNDKEVQKGQCHRFVYLGQIRQIKGIREIIKAGERFGDGIIIDIYGTLDFDVPKEDFDGLEKVRYCGVVNPENVLQVLGNYDVLLLPTLANEGYPGVILEAYSAGLPVISTRMGAIQEIVDEDTGILIEPHNVEELYEAIRRLINDQNYYHRLCNGVIKRRVDYSSDYWTDQFVAHCKHVITVA